MCLSSTITSCLFLIRRTSPPSYSSISRSQISYLQIVALNHSLMIPFRPPKLSSEKAAVVVQPNDLEKSLPVPIGMIPKIILWRSIPASMSYWMTQSTDPSPPQMITLISYTHSYALTVLSPFLRESASNRS
jgi:hypothetical protein